MSDLTRLLQTLQPSPDGESAVRHRTAVVDAVNADGTVGLDFAGTIVPDVSVLEGVVAQVGDTVQVIAWAGDLLVLGRTAAAEQGWQDFVPVLETSGVQPVLGTGAIAEGRWARDANGTVFVQWQLKYGSSGVTVGTGNYYARFGGIAGGPPNAQTTMGHVAGNGLSVGQAFGNDNDAGTGYPYHLLIDTNVRVSINRTSGSTAQNTPVSTVNPYTVAVNDRFRGSFWYQEA